MKRRASALAWGLGLGGAILVGAGLVFGLGFAPVIALPIAAVVGGGVGLLSVPLRPAELVRLGIVPSSATELLDAAVDSAKSMRRAVRSLASQGLWRESGLDEELLRQCSAIETLAAQPAIRARADIDGDLQTLFNVATDYLPTIVNLAIENDRMHASFTSGKPRAEVKKNIEELTAQAGVLGEVLERIESDIVRGISRDAAQHTEFLRMRFAETGVENLLDLSRPMSEANPTDS